MEGMPEAQAGWCRNGETMGVGPIPAPTPHAVAPSPRALTQWSCADSEWADPAQPSPVAGRRFL